MLSIRTATFCRRKPKHSSIFWRHVSRNCRRSSATVSMANRTPARRLTFVRWPDKTPHSFVSSGRRESGHGKRGRRKLAPVFADIAVAKKPSLHPMLRAGTCESAVAVLMSGNLSGIARSGGRLAVLGHGGVAPFIRIRRCVAGAIALAERLCERRRRTHRHQHGNDGNL